MSNITDVKKEYMLTQWREIIADCQNSGVSAREYMRQHDITEGKYYYWLP